jgi:hypothetical protein
MLNVNDILILYLKIVISNNNMNVNDVTYTDDELNEFRKLVELGESCHQMDRINSRLDMPHFIERVGKEKCNEMYKVLLNGA